MKEKDIICKERCTLADYCWINIGSARQKIIKSLSSERMPSQVRDDTNLRFSTVSRSLRDLRNRGLVDVAELGDEKFRLYGLTERGQIVLDKMQEKAEAEV